MNNHHYTIHFSEIRPESISLPPQWPKPQKNEAGTLMPMQIPIQHATIYEEDEEDENDDSESCEKQMSEKDKLGRTTSTTEMDKMTKTVEIEKDGGNGTLKLINKNGSKEGGKGNENGQGSPSGIKVTFKKGLGGIDEDLQQTKKMNLLNSKKQWKSFGYGRALAQHENDTVVLNF